MAARPPSTPAEGAQLHPAAAEMAPPARPRPWADREWVTLLRRLVRRRTALFGMLVVLAVMLAAAAAPLVRP